jgi:hypothetical protein
MARFRYIYGEHEDVLLGKHQTACIACNADGKTWRLIRLEEDAVIKVNGEDLHLVHYLSSGDRIDLGGEEETLRFAIRKDGSGDEVETLIEYMREAQKEVNEVLEECREQLVAELTKIRNKLIKEK